MSELKSSKRNSTITVCPTDLVDAPATIKEFLSAEARIQACFGRTEHYNKPKYTALWRSVTKRGWSKKRLNAAVDRFIDVVKFETWTIAEFLECDNLPVFHGEKWMIDEVSKDLKAKEKMDVVKINHTMLYRYHDGQVFPGIEYLQINGRGIASERVTLEKQLNDLAKQKMNLIRDYDNASEFMSKSDSEKVSYIEKLKSFKIPDQAKKEIEAYPEWCKSVYDSFQANCDRLDEEIGAITKQIQALVTGKGNL